MARTLNVDCWQMVAPGEPLARAARAIDLEALPADRVVVRVAGCGVCHTDLSFLYEGVRTRRPPPLTLGHEISGTVVHAGADYAELVGRPVVVPAVIPCGECLPCRSGRGAICPGQVFPGNDLDGGFASHVVVPGRGLCPVDPGRLEAAGLDLADLAVVADAVTTPYQAIRNAGLQAGDVAVFVGAGGVGAFGVQLARALGAHVAALDIDPERLDRVADLAFTLQVDGDARVARSALRAWAEAEGLPKTGWKVFETSGTAAGQTLAFALLGPGGHLGVVGYTREPVTVRLSNLMAFDAEARGTWGCLPEHYPAVVDLVLRGAVRLGPFIERRPMSAIEDTFRALRAHALKRRPVLVPDFRGEARAEREGT